MIYSFGNIYSFDGDLGKAYNDHMKLLPNNNDWAIFTDSDVLLWGDFGHHIEEVIKAHDNIGIITCICNRIGNMHGYQIHNKISDDPNIINHYKISDSINYSKRGKVTELTKFISGMVMVINKQAWEDVGGFPEKTNKVDNRFSSKILRAGYRILQMDGLYVFHYYRLHKDSKDTSHLPNTFFDN